MPTEIAMIRVSAEARKLIKSLAAREGVSLEAMASQALVNYYREFMLAEERREAAGSRRAG